jgi:hypothetical protein
MERTGKRNYFSIVFFIATCILSDFHAQISGCTDPHAINYNPAATLNDGSCAYPNTQYIPTPLASLPPAVSESSGLFFACNALWTFNDSGNSPYLFSLNTEADQINRQVWVNHPNVDWETATTGNGFLFLGDVGNNLGNRNNLVIWKIDLNQLCLHDTVSGEPIRIAYASQTDFTPSEHHDFDAEALCFASGTLHLFSKNRTNPFTYHYVIPADTGSYLLSVQDSLNVGGQITAADAVDDSLIVLIGYGGPLYSPFAYLLWDFNVGSSPFSGNKRRFSLGSVLTMGQQEAVVFSERGRGFISNEAIADIGKPAGLHAFDLSPYLNPLLSSSPLQFVYGQNMQGSAVWLNLPETGNWEIRWIDMKGTVLVTQQDTVFELPHRAEPSLVPGYYVVEARHKRYRLRGVFLRE